MTFVPVAVPVFARVIICSIVSSRRSFPHSFTSLSTAVEIRRGALIVTGTFGVPPVAHSRLLPTAARVGITVPGITFVRALTR